MGNSIPQNIPQEQLASLKFCRGCNEYKSAIQFYSDKSKPDELTTLCKECKSPEGRAKRSLKSPPQGYKRCTSCGQTFLATTQFFHYKKMKKGNYGLTGRCIQCENLACREYYQEHAETLLQYREQYYAEHRDICLDYAQSYREENSEKLRDYRQAHREEINAHSRNRRARKKAAPGKHTHQDILKQYDRQRGSCYYCHKKLGKGKNAYQVDHIVPLMRGGSNDPSNLVISCSTCNQSKSDNLLHEWARGGRLL